MAAMVNEVSKGWKARLGAAVIKERKESVVSTVVTPEQTRQQEIEVHRVSPNTPVEVMEEEYVASCYHSARSWWSIRAHGSLLCEQLLEIDLHSDAERPFSLTFPLTFFLHFPCCVVAGRSGEDGQHGTPGEHGLDGAKGQRGATGPQGAMGRDGEDGTPGATGARGNTGAPGQDNMKHGVTGDRGDQGKRGPAGPGGEKGDTGRPGPTGFVTDGRDGADGVTGPKGYRGQPGTNGEDGPRGVTGSQGIKGMRGDSGRDGVDGNNGRNGPTGNTGTKGMCIIHLNSHTLNVDYILRASWFTLRWHGGERLFGCVTASIESRY